MINSILIAYDSEVFRRVVRTYLNQHNFRVCGEAIDGTELLKKAMELEPALILDFRMPYMNGVEVASLLKRRMPDVRLVLLTMYDEVVGYKSLMSAIGVDAAIAKTDCFNSLAECVRGLLSSPAPKRPKRTEPAGSRNRFTNTVNIVYRSHEPAATLVLRGSLR